VTRGRANLALVPHEPRSPEEFLGELVPSLIEADAVVVNLRRLIAEQGRLLARQRGVAFIRPEQLRREFAR
jgi:hypothetical protein